MRRALLATALALLSACEGGDAAKPDAPLPTRPLALAPVQWNAAGGDLGAIAAVADTGGQVALFGARGATVLAGGAAVSVDGSVTTWRAGGAVPAASAAATWLVGVDGDGRVRRIRVDGTLEDVSDRFGVADAKVADVATSGAAPFAFRLDDGVAVSDGAHVTRYEGAPGVVAGVAAGGGVVAIATSGAVRVLDLAGKETDVALADASFVAIDGGGALYAASHHALYLVDPRGRSAQVLFEAGSRTIHGLVASGANVWLAVDGELGVYRRGQVALSQGANLAADGRLFGSPSGDVWVTSGATLQRFSGEAPASDDEAAWKATVEPINARVCGQCHGPPGKGKDSSNIDLSTYEAWSARRSRIAERVGADAGKPQQMPPPSSGYAITPAELDAIKAWSAAK